ncbi:hypothetical protein HBI56_137400 [Parastagonospora nodorum]|uniref:Nucleotide-diphospho-sugar transferase n=2 Tax=Phaeosphaeria nodorum (strain SN15 / ATCC MYA-4574 / FGSC 10173) TaxID=321614 RepID=A0A7U2I964_PHANO|nr:hypothetical protein SNOG_05811 [Parastagonospora nodorum SN15]KAH3911921.1 hypothetical protein HBH56_130410 [Parastagonospora nodorum]EAT86875.1 hypothetical protein SNOG_05811 [Parastagonospora nodorum SN15]KAH3931360.1 hypothetical protein HBH54_093090 [Parastagonospora nodorum]KAH3947261.1 hypothetical protein HBH53_120770 [Parastagonospora nodorum]KAH3970580.1 hypothetical protein HBH51_117090 [Parastagonospora nodorum]
MLRPVILFRILTVGALLYALSLARRQYLFQNYLHARRITSTDFPAPYVKVLNDSVAEGKQPPKDFDYTSTFPQSQIPKTIHFIWFQNLYPTNDHSPSQIPTTISRAPELCREHNPDYEINIWNATSARTFIAQEYSWFLPTYDGYRHPIQRIDSLKYFALYHFGGVYMDLDISCRRPLDPLLQFSAWFPEASPLGVNNDLMAAAARHPIFKRMTTELERHDKNWLFPYLTIFWSTGPQFTSDILKEWFEHYKIEALKTQMERGIDASPSSFFVLPQVYYSEQYTFFGHSPGGTWHGGDVAVVLWFVGKPWILLLILVPVAAAWHKLRKRQRRLSWSKSEDKSNPV